MNTIPPLRKGAQSGQAIILIAFIMVGLIGALGLAIDGGGLLFLYRDIQNATDAAIVAATYARCTGATSQGVINAGLQAARDNGFETNGTSVWVTVSNPPPNGVLPTGTSSPSDYVQVTIRAAKPSYFIQLVYRTPLEVTNGSVGHCRQAFDTSSVGAVFGISTTCNQPSTVNFQGADQQTYGNVHSNAELKSTGSNHVVWGTGTYVQSNQGGTYTNGTSQVTPRPDPLAGYFPRSAFAVGGRVYEAARAKSIALRGDESLIHVITGNLTSSNLEGYYLVSGNVNVSNAVVGAQGVTIIAAGTIDFHTTLNASYFVSGLLLYTDNGSVPCNGQGVISFRGPTGNGGGGNGNSDRTCGPGLSTPDPNRQVLRGVIYAPNGMINYSVPRSNLVGALVGNAVSSSAARSCIWYDPDILDPIPPQVEIAQ
ncbi:MAG: Tad domain-containing protein [Anaerolineae bacterium]